ncbi:ATP-binding protein [Streptoalloteichus hindustanus]|uniref:Predicted kinase n=1 Tax=Streptoalloteichus hindustanus TaxID=2017 RepID=A0A1M4YYL0_STRHI|nr:ATP-binding protein [Streptoalloteichus hindustanus]SHF10426.1 Predicted kinase [Streptoalloteichus hindustanus]
MSQEEGHSAGDHPEVAVLIGLQASGKTTFYRRRLAATHVHVSKDLMRNVRRKEVRQNALIDAALARGESVAVDNTNPSVEERRQIIAVARVFHARVVGYWFPPDVPTALTRNAAREGRERVPEVGLFATLKRLVPPRPEEGFDQLFVVRSHSGDFDVRPWRPEPDEPPS